MKQTANTILFLLLLLITGSLSSHAQTDTWVQKNDLGYNAVNVPELTPRIGAVGFCIGSKGYIGTGYNGFFDPSYFKDFWEYDPATSTWTQKADFGGTARSDAVGFSIGSKGYLGTGKSGNYPDYFRYQDFWEYDPAANTWTQKADFGGAARSSAAGFSIGSKGYLGTGTSGFYPNDTYYKDFWEYNPAANTWTQKADFGGTERFWAVGFSIDSKGYLGTGYDGNNNYKDFWEYDPVSNLWTQKADCGGQARGNAVGFSIGTKGYIGTGGANDFWEYDPSSNIWTPKADIGGIAFLNFAVGFSINNKGYIGTGDGGTGLTKEFWEYDPAADTWTQNADFRSTARYDAVGFNIGNKGYLGTGSSSSGNMKDFWEYDPATNIWTQKADFGGTVRSGGAVGFSIGSKGYLGTGGDRVAPYKDFWEYDPANNIWTQKADFGGTARTKAVGFSIGSKGYLGTGGSGSYPDYIYYQDFWEYDPVVNKWTQKADFGGTARSYAVGFSIGDKGYLGTGTDISYIYMKDFWEYNPAVNIWTQKADFGGTARWFAVGFSISNKGYIGTGGDIGGSTKDFWEYDPVANIWTQKMDFGGSARMQAVGFSISGKGYIGTGGPKDFWEYTPDVVLPLQLISFTAALQKTNAVLKWQTANEINTSHFNIQRSFNGNSFATIAKQKAAGNGIRQEYIYSDENVTALQQSKIFYRLQMVDRDGSFTYSNIVQLKVNNSNGVFFSISPNPAKDKLHISINCAENTTLSIRILDMQGRQVYTTNLNAVAGSVQKDIDINKMAKGIYSIQLISDKGTNKSSFVKE